MQLQFYSYGERATGYCLLVFVVSERITAATAAPSICTRKSPGFRSIRSDIRLKTDVAVVGRLDSGLGLYRFRYRGEPQTYVGVMAQDAQLVRPDAVTRGRDGYLRVRYDKIGFEMQPYETWTARSHPAHRI